MSELRTTDQRLDRLEAKIVSLKADIAETRKMLERLLAPRDSNPKTFMDFVNEAEKESVS